MALKQTVPTEKTIGDYNFYIRPFPAFTAARISGDLAALLTPMLAGLTPLLGSTDNISNIDVNDAASALGGAMSGLSGESFEKLMKELLTDYKNISVEGEATDDNVKMLTYDLANEVFCGEVQDMFILCWYVIQINFNGFFKKLADQFGGLFGTTEAEKDTTNTARLTRPSSAT